jgi:hypothetical protein
MYSRALLDELLGRPVARIAQDPLDILRSMLDPFDVEDLVYVYLQAVRDWLVLPASRNTSTATYEYVLVHRTTRQLAIAQVKTGASAVQMNRLSRAAGEDHVAFAYSTEGRYEGSGDGRITVIGDEDLLSFVSNCPQLLPPRVRRWFAVAAP